jgi:hypothetical protein
MTKADRTALVYGGAVVAAAAVSYFRGKRDLLEIGTDAVLYGALLGTGVNVVLWLQDGQVVAEVVEVPTTQPVFALNNNGENRCEKEGLPYGKLAEKGLELLSNIDQSVLYKAMKMGGVAIGIAPEDPNVVILPED